MSNWERLVEVVLRMEEQRQLIDLADSRRSSFSSISSSSRFEPDSPFPERNLQLNSNAVNLLGGQKQQIVIRVSMNGQKSRIKAMKTAVRVSGVESVAITGAERNQLVVFGDGIDAVALTKALEKNVAAAKLIDIFFLSELMGRRAFARPPASCVVRLSKIFC